MEVILVIGLLVAVVFGGLGGWIAGQKYRSGIEGFWLGFLFGPLGCLIEAMLPSQPRPAPIRTRPLPPSKPRRSSSLGTEWVPDFPEDEDIPLVESADGMDERVLRFLTEDRPKSTEDVVDAEAIRRAVREAKG